MKKSPSIERLGFPLWIPEYIYCSFDRDDTTSDATNDHHFVSEYLGTTNNVVCRGKEENSERQQVEKGYFDRHSNSTKKRRRLDEGGYSHQNSQIHYISDSPFTRDLDEDCFESRRRSLSSRNDQLSGKKRRKLNEEPSASYYPNRGPNPNYQGQWSYGYRSIRNEWERRRPSSMTSPPNYHHHNHHHACSRGSSFSDRHSRRCNDPPHLRAANRHFSQNYEGHRERRGFIHEGSGPPSRQHDRFFNANGRGPSHRKQNGCFFNFDVPRRPIHPHSYPSFRIGTDFETNKYRGRGNVVELRDWNPYCNSNKHHRCPPPIVPIRNQKRNCQSFHSVHNNRRNRHGYNVWKNMK